MYAIRHRSIMAGNASSMPLVVLFSLIFTAGLSEMLEDVELMPVESFNRSSFPSGFVFGAGSASYQFEGAANEGGRKPSIWDVFTHNFSDRISDGSNGDVATDFYHRYKEDLSLMSDMGSDAFRFSISWSRIIPSGKLSEGVNQIGIDFYSNLINEMLAKGLQPFATIFHWDLPEALEREYSGFLSPRIVDDFADFAELCYREFGDRVKYWMTMNEPWTYSDGGYDSGMQAPGRCSRWVAAYCRVGNSATEPYIVAHNFILAHGAAVKIYREKYQISQKGKIGVSHAVQWMVPYSDSEADKKAAERELDFMYGWFMEPMTYGRYPSTMRQLVGARLPNFTKEQSDMLKGSYDFVGVNYYTAYYAIDVRYPNTVNVSYENDALVDLVVEKDGKLIGPQAASSWLHVYPKGIHNVLIYTKEKYNNPTIYITENGYDEYNNLSLPVGEAVKDPLRIDYHYKHLIHLLEAIKDGVNVKGYFAWAATDNFQWSDGYTKRFGVVLIDFGNGLRRYPKDSYYWFKKFLLK
uniref:Beta-glucosidase n=1 Tax=Kalanchoe fedtschenkoi TaxID=63787 RepID=A0A7N0UAU8_KALFE